MTMVDQRPAVGAGIPLHIEWGAVIAGAIAAAALSFVLLTFGTALGLALNSTSPTWRDTSVWLWVLTGLYLVLVAIASFSLGGYIAGRLNAGLGGGTGGETLELHDGAHGVLAWALAVLIAAVLTAATAANIASQAAP